MKYRGKCKGMCDEAVSNDPFLTLVRGHYFCPIWNTEEPHWWCVTKGGDIYNPTAKQFPSNGLGIYTPFSGMIECAQCSKQVTEEEALFESNYAFCCSRCFGRFVGIY